MHKIFLTTILLSLILGSCTNSAKDQSNKEVQADSSSTSKDYPRLGRVEILDPAMLNIVDSTAQVEKLADGMTWAEGPVWVKEGNYLLYSDTRQNIIYGLKLMDYRNLLNLPVLKDQGPILKKREPMVY